MAKRRTPPAATEPPPVTAEDVLHLGDLVPDPENRREHTARNIGMIEDSLSKVGAARSIVIDEGNRVLAGNGVLEGAGLAGITRVQVVEADGNTIIAVRRRGLTEEQKRLLAIYDNRTAELARWNLEQLAKDMDAGQEMKLFFTNDEMQDLAEQMEAHQQLPARPEFNDLIDTFEAAHGKGAGGDEYWFYVEFYNAADAFQAARGVFPPDALRGKHEIRREVFMEMLSLYADKHKDDAQ